MIIFVAMEEEAIFQQDELRLWFGDSKAVDENGRPLVLSHGTTLERFRPRLRYGMGPHFSSAETARERLGQASLDYGRSNGRVVKAYLRIENPIRMKDTHFDEAGVFADGLIEAAILSRTEARELLGPRDEWFGLSRAGDERLMRVSVQHLKEAGFDGIAYRNFIEGRGDYTWIPFGLDQIWVLGWGSLNQ